MGIGFEAETVVPRNDNEHDSVAAHCYEDIMGPMTGGQQPGQDLVLPGTDRPAVVPMPVAPPRIEIPSVADVSGELRSATQNREPLPVRLQILQRLGIAGMGHAEDQVGNGQAATQQRARGLDVAITALQAILPLARNTDALNLENNVARLSLGVALLQRQGLLELTPANVAAAQNGGGPRAAEVNTALSNIYTARTQLQAEVDRLAALGMRNADQQTSLDQFRAIIAAMPTVVRNPGDTPTYTLTGGGNRANLMQALLRRYPG